MDSKKVTDHETPIALQHRELLDALVQLRAKQHPSVIALERYAANRYFLVKQPALDVPSQNTTAITTNHTRGSDGKLE